MFHETQCVAAGVDSVAHRHKLVYVWETLNCRLGSHREGEVKGLNNQQQLAVRKKKQGLDQLCIVCVMCCTMACSSCVLMSCLVL